MFERLLAWFLNNYLSKYLENLNTDQLSIALLQGEVELDNVPLKGDILDIFGLPLQMYVGFVGKVRLQIPFRKLRSEPWVISFEQAYLLAGPKDVNEPYNEDAEESYLQEKKLLELERMEAEWRTEHDPQSILSSSFYSSTYSSWFSYGANLVTNILQNVELKIKDMHIRYEDSVSCSASVFACGIQVESLTCQTCDSNWIPKFMSTSNQETMFKLVELDQFSLYWETNAELFSSLPFKEMAEKMALKCQKEFLLLPVSGHAHLKHNCTQKPLCSLNIPRTACDFQLEHIIMELRDIQYHQMVHCCRSLEFLSKGLIYRRWRPLCKLNGRAKLWWKFAYQCVLYDIHKKSKVRDWNSLLQRARDVVFYVQSYKDHISNAAAVSSESKLQRDRIEIEMELEELQILRSVALDQMNNQPNKKYSEELSNTVYSVPSSQTLLQRWIYSWTPWSLENASQKSRISSEEQNIEHEIIETLELAMRDNTLSQNDTLQLQLTFSLKQGNFRFLTGQLISNKRIWSNLLELEVGDVHQQWESRPKLKSYKCRISLGNVCLRDCSTPGTLFPSLISPQRKEPSRTASKQSAASLITGFGLPFFRRGSRNSSSSLSSGIRNSDDVLFDLVYEKRPPGCENSHLLKVTSLALECVYSRQVIQKLLDFFTVHDVNVDHRSRLGQRIREAARSGFEAVKQKTKEELSRTWIAKSEKRFWDLDVDISAPHILVPESVTNKDSHLVVIDFGHLSISRTKYSQTTISEEDCDEEYQTPCSTPPNELTSSDGIEMSNATSGIKEFEDMVHRYSIHLSDLQVLVCRVKDNWKQAHHKGISAIHLLDRFSILIHVEKPLRMFHEIEKPTLIVTGSLPNLIAHVNEPKVQALMTIANQLQYPVVEKSIQVDNISQPSGVDNSPADMPLRNINGQWIMMQFTIDQLSVEVHSRGRSIAELQVGGVQANYSLRQGDNSIRLAVHSLLLVDAMQTLGADYELLIASHKHLCMDSMSGSLKESGSTSPISPSSPDVNSYRVHRATSPITLAEALSSLQRDTTWGTDDIASPSLATSTKLELAYAPVKGEALITVEVTTIEPSTWIDEKSEKKIHIVNVNFNSLDVIANQETVVELISFFQRILPKKPLMEDSDDYLENLKHTSEYPILKQRSFPSTMKVPEGSTEMTFDFHRLNVLLLRSIPKEDALVGRKVATLTITEARIHASLTSDIHVQGSLGGLQILDLTPEGSKHQRVVSVGHDPLVEQHQNLYMFASQGLYSSVKEKNEVKAFSFMFYQPGPHQQGRYNYFLINNSLEQLNDEFKLSLDIKMASLCYTHSTQFLGELAGCISEFRKSILRLAHSLRSTAADMAVDLMHRGTEGLAHTIYVGNHTSFHHEISTSTTRQECDGEVPSPAHTPTNQASLPSKVKFSALLESPIVVIPKMARSSEVLVAHLGQISISNGGDDPKGKEYILLEELTNGIHQEHFDVEIRDMSLYSLNVDEKWRTTFSHIYPGPSSFSRITAQELYGCANHGRPILYDTLLKFSIDRITCRPIVAEVDVFPFPSNDWLSTLELCDVFKVTGCVVSPLQMSLSRSQYQQIIDSLDNLHWNKVEQRNHDVYPSFNISPNESCSRYQTSKNEKERRLVIDVHFQLPHFSMKLLDASNDAIVSLSFDDLIVSYDRNVPFTGTIRISLKSLLLEDLMMKEDSKYRRLISSNSRQEQNKPSVRFRSPLSLSCPDLRNNEFCIPVCNSLPDRLEPFQPRWNSFKPVRVNIKKNEWFPKTPPSSPLNTKPVLHDFENEENLVYIKVLLVDSDCPDLTGKYNSTQKFVDIDFNSLDVTVNLESWVMVLDFFGAIDNKAASEKIRKAVAAASPGYQDWKTNNRVVDSRWEVEVKSFTILLNQKDYEVAEASVSFLTWEMAYRRGNLDITGKLGNITVHDLTFAGRKYRERFITSGNEALDFQYFSFSADDPQLARDYDVRLNLNMASVLYVHTQRFYAECMTLLQQFQQLRQMASRLQSSVPAKHPWRHGTRILLNVEAGSPVILLPVCSSADHLLVIDLGRISVSNCFVMSNHTNSTFFERVDFAVKQPSCHQSHRVRPPVNQSCEGQDHGPFLVDVTLVELSHMDICTGYRLPRMKDHSQVGDLVMGSYVIRRNSKSLLKETCEMKLHIKRNLDSHLGKSIPDVDCHGLLSTVECSIDEYQYKLIRGMLAYNLGEELRYLQVNRQPSMPFVPNSSESSIWKTLRLQIDLINVVLEVTDRKFGPFASINFIDSRLVYESFSDGAKDVDLVSQQVVIHDRRDDSVFNNAKRNIFTQILEPINQVKHEGTLQAEVHFRSTRDFARFTFVVNNMRVLAIFDWWFIIREFLLLNPEEYHNSEMEGTVYSRNPGNSSVENCSNSEKWISTSMKPSPIVVSTGVISKRAALLETNSIPLEFKVNISNSEVVIVEDPSVKDSFAVILKGTAVLTYRPQVLTKPLSCQLNQVEIFSSILNSEEETALSIVDPATVSIELVGKSNPSNTQGILDATSTILQRTLEIQAQQICLRLSYSDMKLFSRILDSFPRQTQSHDLDHSKVNQLISMGFSRTDGVRALQVTNGCLEDAVIWLAQRGDAVPTESGEIMEFDFVDVRMGSINLCVIDDCRDADVPLLEISASQVLLKQSFSLQSGESEGSVNCIFAVEYYNRILSGWEPFVEPFKCVLKWNFVPFCRKDESLGRKSFLFDTGETVNINITRSLLKLYTVVKLNWTEDYYEQPRKESKTEKFESKSSIHSNIVVYRHRSPFVPFALHNATGLKLKFRTITISGIQSTEPEVPKSNNPTCQWTAVNIGEILPFSFQTKGKLRHRDTHSLQTHRIIVEIEGWEEISPVSVDRVGVYFRYASTQNSFGASEMCSNDCPVALDRVLVVIAVTLEGSARKLVTVRSALQVINQLEETVELRMEPPPLHVYPIKQVRVMPRGTYPIPMSHLTSQIWVRPLAEKLLHCFSFCNKPIELGRSNSGDGYTLYCNPISNNKDPPYRFTTNVHRENFNIARKSFLYDEQLAYTIILLSPLVIVNLLPYELFWEIKAVNQTGLVKPGKESSVHTVSMTETVQLSFRIENFVHSSDLVLDQFTSDFTTRIRLYDSSNRLLLLQARITSRFGGAVKLIVSAAYWLVNKAGLPLVFRQEGAQQDAAGQFEEHEMARSLLPMLFSLTDREASPTLQARIGTGLHPGCKSHWCQHFPLHKGDRVRSFRVTPKDGRPEFVYLVGINIRPGRGRYRDTQIITFAPCYQLYNQSAQRIQIAQSCFATTFTDPGAQSTYLNLVTGCHLPFHWPRLDKEQLLCVRFLDVNECHWSGRFPIRNISSFHINIRDSEGNAQFLRVEIVQQECTYCVVFSDAAAFPPPFRIDNLAEVPIVFHQSDVPETYLHTVVRPHTSVPYTWDEPTKSTRLTLIAPGGASLSYDMTSLKSGTQLTYENFIYICFSTTFGKDGLPSCYECSEEELVLDVPEGTRVILSRKETGRRSQLWRMTGSGMLQHEGSSPPRDPFHSQVDTLHTLVLDIAGPALQPSEYVHLMLRKPDPRRQLTQTWRFTEDGRLCCGHSNVFVQAKDGFRGIRQGNDVVLGPHQAISYFRSSSGVPVEQAIHWQRLRPGSGCLTVRIVMDGPTRVLQITDFLNKLTSHNEETTAACKDPTKPNERVKKNREFHIQMRFKEGLGISIVNHNPAEELGYCWLANICVELVSKNEQLTIDGSVQSIQIDNTSRDANCAVVLYASPSSNQDEGRHLPTLHFAVHRIGTEGYNADIFKHLIITFKNLTINVEENQLFKLLAFTGFNQSDIELERMDESDYETHKSLSAATSVHTRRYYFGVLKLVLNQVRLSVFTTNQLTSDLKAIKKKLGLTLIKFEDANIELDPFVRSHPFETAQLLINSIIKHYKDELKSQAARILGSTDFLGNPLGFVNDVTEGVSGFIHEGDVGALVQNVTYGLSNSAAKVTGSLSDGLGRITMDEHHAEVRQRILKHPGKSSDHLIAGIKGFGFGVLGGMTSVFTQTYEGIANEGRLTGLLTGFGKGLVGTVTKPAVGVLDFATGVSSAVRDSSRSSLKEVPRRIRPIRLVTGPGGLLPRYSESHGHGQELLYQLNNQDYQEIFIAYEPLGNLPDSLHMLISSEEVRVFSMKLSSTEVVLEIFLSDLKLSKPVIVKDYGTSSSTNYYIELILHSDEVNPLTVRRPRVRCGSEALARKVSEEINYAINVFDENQHTLSVNYEDAD